MKPDNLAGAAAARWLALTPEERANTGLMAPSHSIREETNVIVCKHLERDSAVHGPGMNGERLVSYGYMGPEKTLAANTTGRATWWRSTVPTSGSEWRKATSCGSRASTARCGR